MSRGGKRTGAGRPAVPREQKAVSVHLKVPPPLLEAIKSRSKSEGINQTQFILSAVRLLLDSYTEDGNGGTTSRS